jgi:PRTRC genetic system protein E
MLKQLVDAMSENITLNLTIMKKGDEVTVMMITKTNIEDPAYENLPPITSSGNPEEVESDLIKAVIEPIKAVATSVAGVKEFIAAKEKADAENKPAKDKTTSEKKVKDKSAGDKKPATEKKELAKAEPASFAEIRKLLTDGEKAVSEKRDISAKAVRARIQNLWDTELAKEEFEFPEELSDRFENYKLSLENLIAERSGGSLFNQAAAEPVKPKEDVVTPKSDNFGLSEKELDALDEKTEQEDF